MFRVRQGGTAEREIVTYAGIDKQNGSEASMKRKLNRERWVKGCKERGRVGRALFYGTGEGIGDGRIEAVWRVGAI